MTDIQSILGEEAEDLLSHVCRGIQQDALYLPGGDYIDRVMASSDRSPTVMRNLRGMLDHGRLAGTGYLSILPVDQGVEHSGGASFAPNIYDQTMFADVEQAFDMGAVAVGATVYFGAEESRRQIQEVSEAFRRAHELGMVTVLWAYLRNPAFKTGGNDYHAAADLTGQANHLAVTIEADIVKQKQATADGGFKAVNFGKTHQRIYDELSGAHPIDRVRYQVANCYMGRIGMINSGGPSGKDDLHQAVRTAVINKRAGGMGLISGRKAFQRPLAEGVELLHAIQDVYLSPEVSIA